MRTLRLKVIQLTQGPADTKNAAGTNLEYIMLSRSSHTQKATSGMIPFMRHSGKGKTLKRIDPWLPGTRGWEVRELNAKSAKGFWGDNTVSIVIVAVMYDWMHLSKLEDL